MQTQRPYPSHSTLVFLVERTDHSGGGVWAALETYPHSTWSVCAENIPRKPKYLGEALREAAMEKRGKKTSTFKWRDIVPLGSVFTNAGISGQ